MSKKEVVTLYPVLTIIIVVIIGISFSYYYWTDIVVCREHTSSEIWVWNMFEATEVPCSYEDGFGHLIGYLLSIGMFIFLSYLAIDGGIKYIWVKKL